jgi:hypothetical protein
MTVTVATELRLLIILSAVMFLPGSAILVISGHWRRWQGLQRVFLAVGLSIAFYPILFYSTRRFLPQFKLDSLVLIALLMLALVISIWGTWRHRVFLFLPDRLEWAALMILGLTLVSRMWFAHSHPFPAWSDSLHHTLLTDLTADLGRLPRSLDPYFPNVLDMYHLGLYALTGTVQSLSRVPAHTALLWTAQFLNGLCGVGIYLVLDRHAGRMGALVGLAIAGLFSAHPALWANWGRFTQLSSLVLLPFAWALFLEMIYPPGTAEESAQNTRQQFWLILLAAGTSAAVFLYHFRVGIFYLILLAVTTFITLVMYRSRERRLLAFRSLLLTGFGFLIIILPTLWDATAFYLAKRLGSTTQLDPTERQQLLQNYYIFPLSSLPYLVAPFWLLLISSLAAVIGLITRNSIIMINLLWAFLLVIVGNLYLLNVPTLNITNLGAILIMLYIPISIIIGAGLEEGLRRLPQKYLATATAVLLIGILVAGLPAARARANTVEQYRQFVSEQDIVAMQWIDENIPDQATFAINIFFWLPNFAHGTDAGYWIPYLTGREIVTTSMLSDGLPGEYWELVQAHSEAAEALETDLNALDALYELGVEYIYIGTNGDFSGPGLRLDFLTQSDAVKILYNQNGAAVLQILPTDAS